MKFSEKIQVAVFDRMDDIQSLGKVELNVKALVLDTAASLEIWTEHCEKQLWLGSFL